MASTPRHHLVPQFLLRRFADAEKKLIMVKRQDLSCAIPTTVNNACNEAGFYRIEREEVEIGFQGDHDPESLEKILSVFESRADRSIRRLLQSQPPWTIDDRYNLANFTALQYVRGPHFRDQLNELGTLAARREMLSYPSVLENSAKGFLRERGKKPTSEAITEFIDRAFGPHGPRLELAKPHAIQASFRFALDISRMLYARPIRLLHFKADTPLLTSDNPVVTWTPERVSERVVALNDAVTITLPLGPDLAMSFATRGEDCVSEAGATRARQINTAVADIASRWIYHHPEMSPLEGVTIPSQRPRWKDEKLSARIDDDGSYRELWQTAQR